MKIINLAALAVIGLMLATAFSGCVGGEKPSANGSASIGTADDSNDTTNNDDATGDTSTSNPSGNGTGGGSGGSGSTTGGNTTGNQIEPLVENVKVEFGYTFFTGPPTGLPGVVATYEKTDGTFEVKPNCQSIIAKIDGKTTSPTVLACTITIASSKGDSWSISGTNLPAEIKIPAKDLAKCTDGDTFTASVDIEGADAMGSFSADIFLYYNAPAPGI